MGKEYEVDSQFIKKYHIDELINNFAFVSGLYSTLLDINGNILVEPSGPTPFLGVFYEMVNNPLYKEKYSKIVNFILDSKQAMYFEGDGVNNESRYAATPLFVNGRFYATWILYAHNKTQNQKLFKSFEKLDSMGEALSEIITTIYNASVNNEREESIKTELEFERQSKIVIEDILRTVSQGSVKELLGLYDQVGNLLDVDYIVFYKFNKRHPGRMRLVDYWAKGGKSKEAEKAFAWNSDRYEPELQNKIRNEGLVIDKTNMTNKLRVHVFNGNVRAIMVYPIVVSDVYIGRLIFIESTKERIWSSVEKRFAKELSDILVKNILINNRIGKVSGNSHVIREVFEGIPAMIMVRKNDNGKILYANKTFRAMVGDGIVGTDSYRFLPKVSDEYAGYEEKQEKKKPVEYKRFIQLLGGNYDVIEHHIEWQQDIDASIVILKPEIDK